MPTMLKAVYAFLLLARASAFVYPPPDMIDEWESLEEYRSRNNIDFQYVPQHINPEYCRYLTEEECQEEDEHGRIGREHIARTHRSLTSNPVGNFKALVLLMQFGDHLFRDYPDRSYYDDLCNNEISAYLLQQSYGRYNVECDVIDWLLTNTTEVAAAAGNRGLVGTRLAVSMFSPLLEFLDSQGTDWSQYDSDGDGRLDAVVVLHSGFASEGGVGEACQAAPTDRIHSQGHTFAGRMSWRSADGAYQLGGFSMASAFHRCQDGVPARMGIMTHEWLHTFGTVDVYDQSGQLQTLGGLANYDIMSNPWGADGQVTNPSSMSAFSKMFAGWVTPTEITQDGIYELRPYALYEEVFKISAGFAPNEYLLIENRQASDVDALLPASGLLIYHIDNEMSGMDRPGFPAQAGWPQNGNHYRAALLQADGQYGLEQGLDIQGASDYFVPGSSIGPSGVVNSEGSFPYPNTDSYQGGTITSTGITISDISVGSDTGNGFIMSFRVTGLSSTPAGPTPPTPTPPTPTPPSPTPPSPTPPSPTPPTPTPPTPDQPTPGTTEPPSSSVRSVFAYSSLALFIAHLLAVSA